MFRNRCIPNRLVALLTLAALPFTSAFAQQPAAPVFKNFRHYPDGQWAKEATTTRNGVSTGPPQTQTTCAGVLDARSASTTMAMGNALAARCTTRVVEDQERVAEYEQVCPMPGGAPQTFHATLHAVDDRTMTMDTRFEAPGMGEIKTHIKSSYQGPCTPATRAAQSAPPSSEMTSEDCAALPDLRRAVAGGTAQCAQMPEAMKAQCGMRIEMQRRAVTTMEQQCK